MDNRTDICLKEVKACLTENILPYWLRLKDPRGGFYGEVKADGTVQYDAPRGVILNARLIWTFAAAYKALACWHYIKDHLVDPAAGEWWWAVLPDGSLDRSQPKAGFWKCPYHNSRMCLQALHIFE